MITVALLGALLGLAVIDSINPSALLAAGFILAKAPLERKMRAIMWYVAGVYVANLVFGVALVLGLDAFMSAFKNALDSRPIYIVQALLGAAMLAWALFSKPRRPQSTRFVPRLFDFRTLFLLGATVTLAEVITAFPYFGAIGLMERAELTLPVIIVILVLYNGIFALPPLLLAVAYRFKKERFDAWLHKRQANAKPSDAMQWIAVIVGVLLLQNALHALEILG